MAAARTEAKATYSVASDLSELIARLQGLTESVRRGDELPRIQAQDGSGLGELASALNGLVDAVVSREQARQQAADQNEQVLLALEELARDQAATLAEQNEELRTRNAELTRTDALKNEFLATVSHELRTPLSAIIGLAELMLEESADQLGAEQSRYIDDIHRSGRHLLGLINDILDLARFDAGRLEFRSEPLDLRVPVREAELITRALATQKSLTLDVELRHEAPCVGDSQRIRQVALNLMSNAVKFTPVGGRVTATVRRVGDQAELEVRDTGIGIDPAFHATVFEVFRQVDGSETRSQKGSGLGLALVKKFCEAMGGSVAVQSALGEGATFTVRLPSTSAAAPVEQKPRIILCDRLGPAATLGPTLEALSFDVEFCASPEALTFGATPQLLLIDLFTPQSALAALQRARALAGDTVPSLVIVSAETPTDDLQRLVDAGAQVLPSGGGQAEPLLARLQQVKSNHRQQQGRR